MSWRPIDFQGIINLDRRIVDQLEQYLKEKENRLAQQIVHTLHSLFEISTPTLPIGSSLKLSEAVEEFSKKVQIFVKNPADVGINHCDQVVKELNSAFWEYTEVLEGVVAELFQQVRQVPINRWHLSIAEVMHAIKVILLHRIEDVLWAFRRLEKPVKEYCQKFETKRKKWSTWFLFNKNYLDSNLLRNLTQSEKYLKTRYEAFQHQYQEYMLLSAKAEESLDKMQNFPILALLDVQDQNLYVDVYRLLKMLEINGHPKKEIAVEITRALKHLTSIDHILRVFRIYYLELNDAFFNSSLEWKSLNQEGENYQRAQEKLQHKVKEYQQELRQLIQTMGHYRTFMLKNHPNPYVRSRFGFTEWIVGPEPAKAKKLLHMIYAVEELGTYFARFSESLKQDLFSQQQIEFQSRQEIDRLLHEMGQPLISHSMMRQRVGLLLEQLDACDELGSPQMATIDYVDYVLAKAMREDWKYHVLHEFPLFHQIYRLHESLAEYIEDPTHAFRLERFHLLFDQIREWVEKEDIYAHVHEIGLDVNDMKTYLQDFLAVVQRTVKEKSLDPFLDETILKYRQQLLEYRYVFGQFFLDIMKMSPDGQQLRNQFLFVDQYFESIESLIEELSK